MDKLLQSAHQLGYEFRGGRGKNDFATLLVLQHSSGRLAETCTIPFEFFLNGEYRLQGQESGCSLVSSCPGGGNSDGTCLLIIHPN